MFALTGKFYNLYWVVNQLHWLLFITKIFVRNSHYYLFSQTMLAFTCILSTDCTLNGCLSMLHINVPRVWLGTIPPTIVQAPQTESISLTCHRTAIIEVCTFACTICLTLITWELILITVIRTVWLGPALFASSARDNCNCT